MRQIVFESKRFFVEDRDNRKNPRIDYINQCDGKVAVDVAWIYRGYAHAATYGNDHHRSNLMDWCSENANGEYMFHNTGRAVLFKDESIATQFKLTWG